MAEKYSVIGKRLPLIDSVAKVTGEAKFTDDLAMPGMLIGRILRSPHPHARILHIDASRALKLTGVRTVVTGNDTAGIKYGAAEPFCDEYMLAIDKVRYIGDEVAAVAAVDEQTAKEALNLIKVEYEPLPAVFTPDEAMKPGAPRIHDHVENNTSHYIRIAAGDVQEGFKESDYIFEDTYQTQPIAHAPLESHASVAWPQANGRLTVWSSTQAPFRVRADLAHLLSVPVGKIRVIQPFVGGGFGGKREIQSLDFCAALLALKSGRPVKITYDREEEFSATRRRLPMSIYLKTGVKRDGTLVAKYCRLIADGGAYNGEGPMIISSGANQLTLAYRFPHFLYEGYHVYTNNPVTSSMRGFGNTQMRFADDCQMDRIAREFGISPVDLRLKNARQRGEVSLMGAKLPSCALTECIETACEASDFRGKWGKLPPGRGIGIACTGFVTGSKIWLPFDSSSAFVKINEDGSVSLLTGASDIGQGSNTVLAQLVAEELGILPEEIAVTSADTDVTPFDLGAYASRTTFIAGNAALTAARDAKCQLFEAAAEKLEANPDDLELKNRSIQVKGAPHKSISICEAVKAALFSPKGMPIMGRGYYNPPTDYDPQLRRGSRSAAYSFAAQVAEVEVNPETGQVKILRLVAAQDCGRALNPLAVEGQIEGSVSMGIGQAFYEDLVYEQGQSTNTSYAEYKIPSARDMPSVECHIVESIDPEGPYGAKGIGEMTQLPTCPAIANAIYDAIGVQIKTLPITPEKILAALKSSVVRHK